VSSQRPSALAARIGRQLWLLHDALSGHVDVVAALLYEEHSGPDR
jgi:hypothetical protein